MKRPRYTGTHINLSVFPLVICSAVEPFPLPFPQLDRSAIGLSSRRMNRIRAALVFVFTLDRSFSCAVVFAIALNHFCSCMHVRHPPELFPFPTLQSA